MASEICVWECTCHLKVEVRVISVLPWMDFSVHLKWNASWHFYHATIQI